MSSCIAHFSNLVQNPILADFEKRAFLFYWGRLPHNSTTSRDSLVHIKCHSEHWTTSRKITGVVLAVIALLLMVGVESFPALWVVL